MIDSAIEVYITVRDRQAVIRVSYFPATTYEGPAIDLIVPWSVVEKTVRDLAARNLDISDEELWMKTRQVLGKDE